MFDVVRNTMLKWLWVSGAVIIADHISKYLIRVNVEPRQAIEIFPFFNIVFVKNTGAAAPVRWLIEWLLNSVMSLFGVQGDVNVWQRWFLSTIAILVSIFIIRWIQKLERQETWNAIALALILGGAIGNLIDRIALDYVVDFLDFHMLGAHFPAFNIADSAITIGAIMLILDVIKGFKAHRSESHG